MTAIDWRKVQARLGIVADGFAGKATWAALLARVGAQPVTEMHRSLGLAASVHFPTHDITTPLRLAHSLAQSSVETRGFTRLEENLSYSAKRITEVWPTRFASISAATPYVHKPEALANKVYGGRYGNTHPGDGYRYRGRGTKQTTFLDNYAEVHRVTGLDVVKLPDLLAEPDAGTLAGCIYWRERGCNALADRDDAEAVTRRVNGGTNGLPDRLLALKRAKAILL